MDYDSTKRGIKAPIAIVVNLSNTLAKWSLVYNHNESPVSKHNLVCRFLNYFPVKDIIGIVLAARPDSSSSDYLVWDAVVSRYEDIYDMLGDKDQEIDPDTWSTLDFVISLIVADADEEIVNQLMERNITDEGVYLFEHWVGPTSALMEHSSLYDECE